MALWQWSKTATSNNTSDPSMNWSEGIPPSIVDDNVRAVMARVAEWRDDISGSLTTGGSATAYTLTTNEGINTPTPTTGQMIAFAVNVANGASATLAVDGGSAYPIQSVPGTAAPAGLLTVGVPYTAEFNGTAWLLRDGYAPIFTGAVVFNSTATFNGAATFNAAVTVAATASMSAAAFNEANATIASAATVNIGAAAANYLFISGTTTITAFDTVQAGTARTLEFQGALTLTHNATSLILPGSINITTAAGDSAIFRSEGSGNWRCISYVRKANPPIGLAPTAPSLTSDGSSHTYTPSSGAVRILVRMWGPGGGGGSSGSTTGANGGAATIFAANGGTNWSAGAGSGGNPGNSTGAGGAGGTNSTGSIGTVVLNFAGQRGGAPGANAAGISSVAGAGGSTPVIGGGGASQSNAAGLGAVANSGSGGAGGAAVNGNWGAGGGSGGYLEFWVTAPTASTYTIGQGGAGGSATGTAGGAGAAGNIVIEEFYW